MVGETTVQKFAAHMRDLEAEACPIKDDVPLFNSLVVETGTTGLNYRECMEYVLRRRQEINRRSSRLVQ